MVGILLRQHTNLNSRGLRGQSHVCQTRIVVIDQVLWLNCTDRNLPLLEFICWVIKGKYHPVIKHGNGTSEWMFFNGEIINKWMCKYRVWLLKGIPKWPNSSAVWNLSGRGFQNLVASGWRSLGFSIPSMYLFNVVYNCANSGESSRLFWSWALIFCYRTWTCIPNQPSILYYNMLTNHISNMLADAKPTTWANK